MHLGVAFSPLYYVTFLSYVKCDDLYDSWSSAGQEVAPIIWPHKNFWISFLASTADDTSINLSVSCRNDLKVLSDGIYNDHYWAIEFLDSNSKFAPGLMSYQILDYGHYHQCLGAIFEDAKFVGRYSLIQIHWKRSNRARDRPRSEIFTDGVIDESDGKFLNRKVTESDLTPDDKWTKASFKWYKDFIVTTTLTQAICYPSSCSKTDAESVIEAVNLKYFKNIHLEILTAESMTDANPWPLYRVISSLTLLTLLLLVGVASTTSIPLPPSISAFDARVNVSRLLDLGTGKKTQNGIKSNNVNKMSFLNGFKFIYLVQCVWGHQFIALSSGYHPILTAMYRFMVTDHPYFRFLRRLGTKNVASNSAMASILSTMAWYPLFKSSEPDSNQKAKLGNSVKDENGNQVSQQMPLQVTFGTFVIPRLLRLLPVVIAYQLIVFALPSFGSGPLSAHAHEIVARNCVKNGWMELLFISNYLDHHNSCNLVGWYLSADMQLYMASYFFIRLLAKSTKNGLIACLAVMAAAMVAHGNYMEMLNLPAIADTFPFYDCSLFYTISHFPTHIYIPPYLVGAITGYLIVDGYKISFSKFSGILISMAYVAIFSAIHYLNDQKMLTRSQELILGSTYVTFESAIHSLIIYTLYNHQDWLITRSLSIYPIKIISRLMFSAFPVSSLVITFVITQSTTPPMYTLTDVTLRFIVIFILTLFFATIVHLVIEAPFATLAKMFLSKKLKKSEKNEKAKKVN